MCGIAGYFNPNGDISRILKTMSKSLVHRGPDDEGYFFVKSNWDTLHIKGKETHNYFDGLQHIDELANDSKLIFGLTHRRLSIIDLSPMGHQPMEYENKYVIVFNGEIYNYIEIKEELKSEGYIFKTNSDTEVILVAYEKWGVDCVNRFIGMWAFALYDKKGRKLFLSRDRFGIKPLFYFFKKNVLGFASEMKALFESNVVTTAGNINNIVKYLYYGNIQNEVLFRDVKSLDAGFNLMFDLTTNEVSLKNYYDLKKIVDNTTIEINLDKYYSLLNDSVKMHLRSDVQVGACLSGGLDSSNLVYLSSLHIKNELSSFTASYPNDSIDESRYANIVIDRFRNVKGNFCYPKVNGFFEELESIIYYNEYPINSTSIYSQWEVMKTINKNNIKVIIDGQGADEILGGYYPFAGIFLIEKLMNFNFVSFLREYRLLKENFTKKINLAIFRSGFYFLPEYLQKMIRKKKRIGYSVLSSNIKSLASSLSVPQLGGKTFFEYSLNSIKYGLTELLRYEDRNSMAFSIESRVPFLDHRLVEFALGLPSTEKIKDGWTKYPLRKNIENILPKEIVYRKDKIGFATPQLIWKHNSADFFINFLDRNILPPFLDKRKVENLIQLDLSDLTQVSEYWRIIAIIQWYNLFKVSL